MDLYSPRKNCYNLLHLTKLPIFFSQKTFFFIINILVKTKFIHYLFFSTALKQKVNISYLLTSLIKFFFLPLFYLLLSECDTFFVI
ncbi:hypothetical protein GLOIN_2v527674 [Rhizophagus irregularis DAOM 181602=DAOM 197198]|uniref:Uncharacterized protein n=1 Tax=Rhizophagus irregularis (strain DAOM 181602 / DAOM 197198 / MUCL 43194) TaxID=747089 RepID=A0A2P4PE84_RHIID|nr:hypothetical protein GLOIN_2v527674 [Rhizophagus irregularis DAOM 181602=DAOM 197198]POG63704.1 hypothetical protein GLOIN_2v527674 [Rhizophagus irregularis DAOM 181602=DAOM 197198]GET56964.1 hypothetical protein GLOIN_2v527674 [Rhizophagus irregularis DAOM 181602=DAOM 197198]|eukprot:XP_025170570.1 hypothetical protein GLOIN_2v527674 [Rhizophagus irregularis DAOM 181602=DAOM 197198]